MFTKDGIEYDPSSISPTCDWCSKPFEDNSTDRYELLGNCCQSCNIKAGYRVVERIRQHNAARYNPKKGLAQNFPDTFWEDYQKRHETV